MKHIVIGDGKLKLMLTREDLEKYSIDLHNRNGEAAETRNAFRKLLYEVGEKIGFDMFSDRFFIKFYPSADGGGEMYVSKLYSLEKQRKKYYILDFARLTDVLEICKKLSDEKYSAESSVYEIDEKYYLLLSGEVKLSEFDNNIADERLCSYIAEHGKALCTENAVNILGEYA